MILKGFPMDRLRIYIEPSSRKRVSRINGLYIDLRRIGSVSPAMVVDAMKSCGVDPKDPGEGFEIVTLIDPENPPKGLDLIATLWNLVVALDLELLRATETLRIIQRAFKNIAVRIHREHVQYSIGLIALTVPDTTIVPIDSRSIVKDLKAYAGAAAGKILVESCGEEALEELLPIIDGVILLPC